MRHLDLFTGIGGFALAARRVWGRLWRPVAFVEKDPFCQRVLRKHFPEVELHGEIREFDATGIGAVDVLTGGFPCQPFSAIGKRGGAGDDRYLWPEMLRVIRECRPTWVVGENVTGIIRMELDTVLTDLEDEGYAIRSFVIPACGLGAWHRRERVWIVADNVGAGLERHPWNVDGGGQSGRVEAGAARSITPSSLPRDTGRLWADEPGVARMVHGVPDRVDRIRAVGNAIVPQIAEQIFRAIQIVEGATWD